MLWSGLRYGITNFWKKGASFAWVIGNSRRRSSVLFLTQKAVSNDA